MYGGFTSRVTLFLKDFQTGIRNVSEYATAHPGRFGVRERARRAPREPLLHSVHRALHKQGVRGETVNGEYLHREFTGRCLSLQQIPTLCGAWQKAGQRQLRKQRGNSYTHAEINQIHCVVDPSTNAKIGL